MKTIFVDSNVFLRYFLTDDVGQSAQAERLFQQAADGKVTLVVWIPVLFEIAWVLRAAYQLPRENVLDILAAIASLKGLRLIDAEIITEAIKLAHRTDSEFADACIAVAANRAGAEEVASFNRRHFKRLGSKLAIL